MNRKISLAGLLLIIINGTVGSAWLFAPYYAAKIAGPASIWSWILGGLMTIVIALTFSETAANIPKIGGTTHIACFTHGELTAFVMSWIAWLSSITIPAIEVQAVLQYAAHYLPFLMEKNQLGAPVLSWVGLGCATLLMFVLIGLNIRSMKAVIRGHIIILFLKVSVIFLTIGAIMWNVFHSAHFFGLTHLGTYSCKSILTALAGGGVAFAFVGFKHGVELSGEVLQPQKTVPLAIIFSILICLCLYLGLQMTLIGAISSHYFSEGWQHLSSTSELGPFVAVAAELGLFWLVKLLMTDAIVSPLGAGSVYVASTARLTYAMSQYGYFPSILSRLNKNDMPMFAIVFNSVIGCLFFLPLPNWQSMVQFLTSILVLSYAMGPVALLSMRKKNNQSGESVKLPCVHFLSFAAFYFCNLISYWTGWETVFKTVIVLFLGLLVLIFAKRKNPQQIVASIKSAYWLIPYFAGLSVISYLGAFGGKNCIPFGWDFLIMGVFSFIVFQLAIKCRVMEEIGVEYAKQS